HLCGSLQCANHASTESELSTQSLEHHNETLSNGRVLSSLLRLLNLWVAGKAFEATWLSVLCSVRQYFLAFYSLALMPQMSQSPLLQSLALRLFPTPSRLTKSF